MVALAACDGGGDGVTQPTTGTLQAGVTVAGTDPDAGFLVAVDGGAAQELTPAAARAFAGLAPGQHTVTLSGVATNCVVQGANPLTVSVQAGGIVQAPFAIACTPRQVAFHSDADGDADIYVVDRLGGGLTQLTNAPGSDFRPRFSPDGAKIAFYSGRSGRNQVWVMNADGSGQHALLPDDPAPQLSPVWSPDGTRIAYVTPFGITIVNADGTSPTALSVAPAHSPTFLAWSPDGARIAFTGFTSTPDEFHDDIYTVAPATGQVTRLTTDRATEATPEWTPDGRIVFASTRAGSHDLYVMNADGTGQTALLVQPGPDYYPAPSPDGQRLALVSTGGVDAPVRVWIRGPTGEMARLTHPASEAFATESAPHWRP